MYRVRFRKRPRPIPGVVAIQKCDRITLRLLKAVCTVMSGFLRSMEGIDGTWTRRDGFLESC